MRDIKRSDENNLTSKPLRYEIMLRERGGIKRGGGGMVFGWVGVILRYVSI